MPAQLDFRAVFDGSPDACMVLDRELRYVAANGAYLALTGSRLADLLGRHILAAFPHDPDAPENANARMLRESFERVLESGAPDVLALIHYRVPRISGGPAEDRLWSATHTPIFDAHGEVAFIVQHTEDVTELQRLRAGAGDSASALEIGVFGRALQVQQQVATLDTELQHLKRVFDQTPGFMCVVRGPEHVFELANAAYQQLVGNREIVGKSVREALPEIAGQGFGELLDSVYRDRRPFVGRGVTVRLQRARGEPPREFVLDFVYQPLVDASGASVGIFVLGQDVTEQKAFEAALRESEERLRRVVEASNTGAWELDLESGRLTADSRMRELSGLPRAGVLELGSFFDRIVAADRARVEAAIRGTLGGGEGYMVEYRVLGDDGLERWLEARGKPLASRDGAARFVGTVSEITERKRAEVERERLLAQESAARAEAERANRLKDEFLATVSHELRTPLTSMLGWVQLLRAGQVSPERQGRALETVERNARAQAKLVDDLLDIGRITSGKVQLEIAPVELGRVVRAALEAVRPAAEAKAIHLEATAGAPLYVMGDAARLQQVIWNLLANAVKFTAKGGQVQVSVERTDATAEISVADTGQGIRAEFVPFVFERFRQADGGIARRHGGLGLGLAIASQLVEVHGGTIAAFSAGEGKGARFTVRLPISAERPADIDRHPADLEPDGELLCPPRLYGLRLLLVDDEQDARELVRAILEQCGAKVRVAVDAAEGLDALRAEPTDVLISDLGMPGEDGYAFIRKVRALPASEGGRVPAIALTAHARAEDRVRALLAGFKAHLPKPVDPNELVASVAAVLPAERA